MLRLFLLLFAYNFIYTQNYYLYVASESEDTVSLLKFDKNAFLIIATSPAKKFLPDGRNAHLIVETPGWWKDKIEKNMPGIKIVHHEFVEKTRTDKQGKVHPNNKYIVVLGK